MWDTGYTPFFPAILADDCADFHLFSLVAKDADFPPDCFPHPRSFPSSPPAHSRSRPPSPAPAGLCTETEMGEENATQPSSTRGPGTTPHAPTSRAPPQPGCSCSGAIQRIPPTADALPGPRKQVCAPSLSGTKSLQDDSVGHNDTLLTSRGRGSQAQTPPASSVTTGPVL